MAIVLLLCIQSNELQCKFMFVVTHVHLKFRHDLSAHSSYLKPVFHPFKEMRITALTGKAASDAAMTPRSECGVKKSLVQQMLYS